MKKIDKLVFSKFIGPFAITFFITLFIIVMQFLWKYIDDMVGKGLEWYIVAELIFYASASFVPLALPLAVLLSSIMTFGSFGENYELVAAKSTGISLLRFMRSTIIMVILISIGAFFFSNNILPHANLKFGTLLYDIRHQKPAVNIKEGVFYDDIEGFSIKVGEKAADNKTIYDILVYDHSSGRGNDNLLVAEKGEMYSSNDDRYLVLKLYDGKQYKEMPDKAAEAKYEHLRTYFRIWEKRFDLTEFSLKRTDEKFWKNHYQMLNLKQLRSTIDTFEIQIDQRKEVLSQNLHQYFSFKKFRFDTLEAAAEVADSSVILDFDALPPKEKLALTGRASEVAKGVKSTIGMAERDVFYKNRVMIKHELAWHRKFTFSVACTVLFFVGAPLGAIIRVGGLGMPMLISVIFFVVFHVLSISGEKVAEESVLTPLQGMWLASAILFPLGLFLTYKSTHDSSLFNFAWYYKLYEKFVKKDQSATSPNEKRSNTQ